MNEYCSPVFYANSITYSILISERVYYISISRWLSSKSHIDCFISVVVSWPYDDVIKWNHFPRYWPFVWGIHQSPVNSPHKGQRRWALMFSLICALINGWVNNGEAGDLRCNCTHYDVIVMTSTHVEDRVCWNKIVSVRCKIFVFRLHMDTFSKIIVCQTTGNINQMNHQKKVIPFKWQVKFCVTEAIWKVIETFFHLNYHPYFLHMCGKPVPHALIWSSRVVIHQSRNIRYISHKQQQSCG